MNKTITLCLEIFSAFLKNKIPSYANKDLAKLILAAHAAGGFFTAPGAILGMTPKNKEAWEVLFFAANDRKGRNQVMRDAIDKLSPKKVVFTRSKHSGREYVRGPEYWERLLA